MIRNKHANVNTKEIHAKSLIYEGRKLFTFFLSNHSIIAILYVDSMVTYLEIIYCAMSFCVFLLKGLIAGRYPE